MTQAPNISNYKDEDREFVHGFYAILSSYLRGRCSSSVRAESENRDGFKLWYDLMQEFSISDKTMYSQPSSNVGLVSFLSMLENILNYEALIDQYEKSSGEQYPSDLKAATLLRCAPQNIREFLQLTLGDDVTYLT